MKQTRKNIGNQGEQLVVDQLEKEGFAIAARNYAKQYGEVDIIAQKGDLLAFIEVKNRYNPLFDMAELIPRSKQKKLIAVAKAFLMRHPTQNITCRFDVALVTESNQIEYIENAFTEGCAW